MSSVYPMVAIKKTVEVIDPELCAARIIAHREADPKASKAQLVGGVLAGSDDVAGFERVWDEVESERVALQAVRVADYDTLSKFKTALSKSANRLDVDTWVSALKAVAGVSTWTELLSLASETASAEVL